MKQKKRLSKLNKIYENEKKEFNNKIQELRDSNEDDTNKLQEEYEEKLSQVYSQHEDEINFLQNQLQQVKQEKENTVGKHILLNIIHTYVAYPFLI